ncbi:MAG: 23S rRNA (adenine(2503)-C(2))-methyltransferase RlmN [Thermoguttaceae bacterium]|nr:23S rRNA (adenine(2503)-C(2))-methyltransferase RlmN [Thermoguttaceae bacterium]MDW8079289.1 23S rRNA (adenine(2503)-C(2))-methyltransferase RlmN [Thermoguttaceae bacterium]
MSLDTEFGGKSCHTTVPPIDQDQHAEDQPARAEAFPDRTNDADVGPPAQAEQPPRTDGASERQYPRPMLTMTPDELDQWLQARGEPRYRLRQVLHWIYQQPVESFEQMSDIPKSLRRDLHRAFRLWTTRVLERQQAEDGTEKLLLRLMDGETVECVLLRDDRGHRTACISTQVGCAMGCAFCASGLGGFKRNLAAYEILEQLLHLRRLLPPKERLTHIVVMGMGEPLANLKNLLAALEVATSPSGLGISGRRVTISTVGIPPAIDRLAETGKPYHLAISLHAPTDELRSRLVPSNQHTGIKAIMNAADRYFAKTGRRVTLEYVLIAGVNDRLEHAVALAELVKNRTAFVNVIAYNPVPELPYRSPSPARVQRFVDKLREAGVNARIRFRKGVSIEAGCGQLRRRFLAAKVQDNGARGKAQNGNSLGQVAAAPCDRPNGQDRPTDTAGQSPSA